VIAGKTKLYALYPPWRDWALWAVDQLERRGFSGTITSGKRSRTEQSRLYQDYISGRSKLPAAPPGRSSHEYGLGLDFEVVQGYKSPQQRQAMALLHQWGAELVAGDDVHAQYPGYRRFMSS
jgi:hypothetical protein